MKSVFRTTPVSLLDIAGLEGWLEERANEGLFPQWVNSDFTQFYRGEAVPGTRFRLEAANGLETPAAEQLELYREAGWEYAHSINALTGFLLFGRSETLYFLFYTADPAAPEPHTDPATQAISLEALAGQVKKWRRHLWVSRLILLAVLVLPLPLLFWKDQRQLPLYLLDFTGYPLLLLPFLLWFWRQAAREHRRVLDLRRSLEQGDPLRAKAPPPRNRARRLASAAATLFALTVLVLAWRGGNLVLPFMDRRLTPIENFSRPYIALAELENEPLASWDDLFGPSSWSEDHNTATWSFSLLAPERYTVSQTMLSLHGGEKNGFSPAGGGEYWYTCHLEAAYFRLTIPAMARSVALAQMACMEAVNLTWHYEELNWPGLDFVLISRSASPYQSAAVARGGRLAVFHYGGREDIAQHLEQLAAAVLE